jgi:phenylacetate-coenzyme A ligase PaaK-like adenylate-forming protein
VPQQSFAEYMRVFDRCARAYIPGGTGGWDALYEALYVPLDPYRIPLDEARALQFRCISQVFAHHFALNSFYRAFCQERGVSPHDIKGPDDLELIPLIPDRFFKDYPQGRDFALWLGHVHTGKLPPVVIKGQSPTFDEVLSAFNSAGMCVSYSSGTGGRHTFIPRDGRTFMACEYALAKSALAMEYPDWDPSVDAYLLLPNPQKTYLFAGRVSAIYFDLMSDVQLAIDREITTELIRLAMSQEAGLKGQVVGLVKRRQSHRMVHQITDWLHRHRSSGAHITITGAPFILSQVMTSLKNQGQSLDFDGRGVVFTAGGWKKNESNRVPSDEFRGQVAEVLGIPPERCFDIYGMVESNGWMVHCPEGHYLHAPYSYFKPLVLGDDLKPVGYGEWGRYAFLDGAALSYPGFIITGDMVRMLEHCPVCDRPGPVLEPEVKRAPGQDIRGCADEVRRMTTMDLGG